MFGVVSSAAIGFFAKASCDLVPKVSWRSNTFKLSFVISSFSPSSQDNASAQRPFVTVIAGDNKKKTELATWCQQQGEWQFSETITLEVAPEEEVTIQVSCAQQYSLGLAAVELASSLIGEVCFPVSSVVPKLRAEDRNYDGIMHTTEAIGFDITAKGARTGRVYVAMETRSPPSAQKKGSSGVMAIADTCMDTKAIADTKSSAFPQTREHMYSERGNSGGYVPEPESYRGNSGGYVPAPDSYRGDYHQPGGNSPWR